MIKKVFLGIGIFGFVLVAGVGIAYAADPEALQGAAARLTQVFVTNWPSNQNVTVANSSPIPVIFGSNIPETKIIKLWENQLVQAPNGPYYTDSVDVDGYNNASIVIKKTGENIGFNPQFSIDGAYWQFGPTDSNGWSCNDSNGQCFARQVKVLGPKMRVYVEPWNVANQSTVSVSLYLTK